MYYYQPEKNEKDGKFYPVCVEESKDGGWAYTRSDSGVTLKTQDIAYYFTGMALSGGYKKEDTAAKRCRDLNAKKGYKNPDHIV